MRQRRCSAWGTKLRLNSCATSRFTRRSASGKSFLRPRGPRFDCACARWSVPDIGPVPSRFWPVGFQYCSSAPQTGFQYCAVDSITTSSLAARSASWPVIAAGRGCYQTEPFKLVLTFAFYVRYDHRQHLFMNVDSRYPVSLDYFHQGSPMVDSLHQHWSGSRQRVLPVQCPGNDGDWHRLRRLDWRCWVRTRRHRHLSESASALRMGSLARVTVGLVEIELSSR